MSELTDAEWREFQSIPDQGYSHRAWINRRIAERLAAERERIAKAIEAAGPPADYPSGTVAGRAYADAARVARAGVDS